MKFEVKTDLTFEEFRAFSAFHKRLRSPQAVKLARLGMITAVVTAVLLAVVILVNRLWSEKSVMIPYCVFVLLLIALPFVDRFVLSRQYKANSSLHRAEYRFGDSGVESGEGEDTRVYTYFAFCDLGRGEGAYYLYVDEGHAMLLPERSFTQGDPAAFGKFIEEKTGLKMKKFK